MSEVTTPTGLPADAWTNIQRDGQTITAYVAEGGEQHPSGRVAKAQVPPTALGAHGGHGDVE